MKENAKQYRTYNELKEARERAGKKPEPEAVLLSDDEVRKRKRRNVTLSPQAIAIAKKIENGNVSRGIERALFEWWERRGKKAVRIVKPGPKLGSKDVRTIARAKELE
jgi:hypothetical protein